VRLRILVPALEQRSADTRRTLSFALAVLLIAAAVLSLGSMALLATVHIGDRYGLGAASGAWMGLAAAARHGVLYPSIYSHGYYAGTRYMPLPIVLEAGAAVISNEYLWSAKAAVYAVAIGLFALVYLIARRRGAPVPVAVAIPAAIAASSAASTTTLQIRWDSLATLLQLGAVALVANTPTPRRAVGAGALCALAVATKFSALWGPIAIVIWLVVRAKRAAVAYVVSLAGATLLLFAVFELASSGRFLDNIRTFAFAGTQFSSRFEGVHRFYQIGLRDQRSLPVLLALGVVAVVISIVRRRIGPYEIGFIAVIPILLEVFRDFGVYENHLIDLEVLAGVVVAGLWETTRTVRESTLAYIGVAFVLLSATGLAIRHTTIPDVRRAFSYELRGRPDPRYALRPLGKHPGGDGCGLFEDASFAIIADERPIVLDSFIVHRLQTQDPEALELLARRVDREEFSRIVLAFPLTDVGWFAALDFGTRLTDAMRAHYRLHPINGLLVYTPLHQGRSARACHPLPLSDWH
jgi:Glycosyltransferase family 87